MSPANLRRILFPLIAGVAVLAVACSSSQPAAAPTKAPGSSQAPAQQPATGKVTEVKVGAVYPLTGSIAPGGLEEKNGIEFAADIVNGKYDLNLPLAKSEGLPGLGGAKVKLVFADHQGTPEKAMSETERLITDEKVSAVIGSYTSATAATASQAAERLGIPFLTPECASPSLTERGFKNFFRTTPTDETFSEAFFKFLKDVEKKQGVSVKNVAIVYENTLWGTDASKLQAQFAKKYGYNVVAQIAYAATSAEVSSELQKLKAAKPDVVILSSYISDALLFMKTFKSQDYTPTAVFGNDAGFLDNAFLTTLGKDGNYVISREVWALDMAGKKPIIGQVNDLFKQKYNMNMNGNIARAFTGTMVLLDAINRAGSSDPKVIRDALAKTDAGPEQLIVPWRGVKFDEKGQNTLADASMVQALGDRYFTVWPNDLAAKDVVWPFPKWQGRQ